MNTVYIIIILILIVIIIINLNYENFTSKPIQNASTTSNLFNNISPYKINHDDLYKYESDINQNETMPVFLVNNMKDMNDSNTNISSDNFLQIGNYPF